MNENFQKKQKAVEISLPDRTLKITVEEKFLHAKFVKFGGIAKEWTRKCALLLPEIEKHEIWRKKHFRDIYDYALKLAGISRSSVDDALWVLKKIENKPTLMKVVERKGINAVRPIVAILNEQNADFWAEKAMTMSRHTLEIYVKEIKNSEQENFSEIKNQTNDVDKNQNQIGLFEAINAPLRRTGPDFPIPEENQKITTFQVEGDLEKGEMQIGVVQPSTAEAVTKKIVAMPLDPQILAQLEKLKGENGDWNDLMKQLLQIREVHLEAQKPEPVKSDSHYIPAKIDKHVTAKTNGQCAFPGCNKKIKIKHHTKRFALEKVHDSDSIYGLCKPHERLAHLGLIENEDKSPKFWKVRKSADTSTETGKAKFAIDKIVQRFRGSTA